jgi:glucose-6-phosphate-specific signal transduction histidine kinase
VAIRDNGVGGADTRRGSGLIGLGDRVEALGGTIEIASVAGHGTSLVARIPIDDPGDAYNNPDNSTNRANADNRY